MKFYVSVDASPETLASGQPLIPGETINLKAEEVKDEHNKRIIESGSLIEVKEEKSGGGDK